MDLAGLVEDLSDVVLHGRALVEVDADGELPGVHLDDGRRGREQLLVVREVFHPQSGRHDDQLHGQAFLEGEPQPTHRLG